MFFISNVGSEVQGSRVSLYAIAKLAQTGFVFIYLY